jgi:CheY-like chemotaxis protein
MPRILLIEDDSEWLELITRALPEYTVDQAQSYDDAIALLASGVTYDVSIVDLNLLDGAHDQLGGRILEIMRDRYPSISRIALTGGPLTAVKAVFDEYAIDDLLLKGSDGVLLKDKIDLAVLRDVVKKALAQRGPGEVLDSLVVEQTEIRNGVLSWRSNAVQRMAQRMRTLENDVADARRVGKEAASSAAELEALRARMQDLEAQCSEILELLGSIRSHEDMARARELFERLNGTFQA